MKFRWKGIFLLLVLCMFASSFSACKLLASLNSTMKTVSKTAYKPDPAPYTPFTPVAFEWEGIDHPELAWSTKWSEEVPAIVLDSPQLDEEGNMYWFAGIFKLFSLGADGELRWTKKGYMGSFATCKEGMILSPMFLQYLQLRNYEDKIVWRSNHTASKTFFSPQGFLICHSYNSLFCLDAKKKLMWHFYIEEKPYDFFSLDRYFFDADSNGYYIFRAYQSKKGLKGPHDFMISLSPDGELRWKKLLSDNETFLNNFLPSEGSIVKDTFLLAYSGAVMNEDMDGIYSAQRSLPKRIVAFNTLGDEVWSMEETRSGMLESSYVIGSDERFYYYFNENVPQEDGYEIVSGHLMCYSKEGELIWDKAKKGSFESNILRDKNNHLYVSFCNHGEIYHAYAFYPDGKEKWQMPLESPLLSFGHNLLKGPQNSFYIFHDMVAKVDCLVEAKAD